MPTLWVPQYAMGGLCPLCTPPPAASLPPTAKRVAYSSDRFCIGTYYPLNSGRCVKISIGHVSSGRKVTKYPHLQRHSYAFGVCVVLLKRQWLSWNSEIVIMSPMSATCVSRFWVSVTLGHVIFVASPLGLSQWMSAELLLIFMILIG